MQRPYQLVLFDMAVGGHHGTYIWHLVKHWHQTSVPITLNIVVSPQFLEQHAEVVDLIYQSDPAAINLLPISSQEFESIQSQSSIIKRAFTEWKIFCQYARQLKADQCMLMQFDHLQLPIVLGERAPCAIAGIYFRPTFHYVQFANYTSTWKDAIRRWRQKLLLTLALRSGQVNTLFSLDPFAPDAIAKLASDVKVTHLSDPVVPHPLEPVRCNQLKTQLKIESDRQIFLLFGKLAPRKGTYQLLEAIRHLPQELSQTLCLLLVGQIPLSEKTKLTTFISEISVQTSAQILIHDDFVPESDMPLYFQLSNVVLAPYQRHVGMSGILLQAAAAQKPVLASNYGLMGELVQRYQLGLAINSEHPPAIAQAMTELLQGRASSPTQLSDMQAFVEQNLVEKYLNTIISHLIC
jgi:glycosyltransferase involved in cell wall biosynthesis